MDFDPTFLFVLFAVVIAVGAYLSWRYERRRREEIARWARENGWRFWPGKRDDPDLPFSPFGQGHSRWSRFHLTKRCEKAVPGLDHADLDLFEYHYAITTHSGKSSSTSHYHFTCALVEAGLDLGEIRIRKEHLFDKIAAAVGFDDIDFEDHEFSRKFLVKSKDRKRTYALIDRRMMAFFVDHPGWNVETERDLLFVFRSGRPNAEGFASLAAFLLELLATLPRTLVNEERERRGLPPAIDAGSAARHHGESEGET